MLISWPKTMATKISLKVQKCRPPPPYLGNIPKNNNNFLVLSERGKVSSCLIFLFDTGDDHFFQLTYPIFTSPLYGHRPHRLAVCLPQFTIPCSVKIYQACVRENDKRERTTLVAVISWPNIGCGASWYFCCFTFRL